MKTFEELLAEKLEQGDDMGEDIATNRNNLDNDNKPKRQFLKRKKPAYVPPKETSTKHYKYYTDAL